MAISGMVFCHFACRDSQASYLGGVFCAFSAMSVDKKHCAICWSALFKIVLGFTPRRRAWKACPSQNDDFLPRFGIYPLYTALQGTSIPKRFGTTLFWLLCGPSGRSVWHFSPCFPFPVFPMLHIRKSSICLPGPSGALPRFPDV